LAALQSLYDRVAVRAGRILDRHALVHSVEAIAATRPTKDLWEEALLDLRDLQLFIHGAFADAVVRMPSAPTQAASLPLVGAGAAASSATLLAKRKRLGDTPTKKAAPAGSSDRQQPPSSSKGPSGRSKLGTPARTPRTPTQTSNGKQRLGGSPSLTPPPALNLDGAAGSPAASPAKQLASAGCPGKAGTCGRSVSSLCGSSPRLCGGCCGTGCAHHRTPKSQRKSPKGGAAPTRPGDSGKAGSQPGGGAPKSLPSGKGKKGGSPSGKDKSKSPSGKDKSKSPSGKGSVTTPPVGKGKGPAKTPSSGKVQAKRKPADASADSQSKRRREGGGAGPSPVRKSTRARGRQSDPASKAAGGSGRSGR
jgi:hypothetical protein